MTDLNPLGGRWADKDGNPVPPSFASDKDRESHELRATVKALREALEHAYEFLGMMHLPDQESSVPGRTTCPVCVAADHARETLEALSTHSDTEEGKTE